MEDRKTEKIKIASGKYHANKLYVYICKYM